MDIAGVEIPQNQIIDGVSLVPLLKGESLDDRSLFWHYPHYGNQGGEPVSIIRKNDWKLIHYWEDKHSELYNLTEDLGETNKVNDANKDIIEKLETELFVFLEETNAKIPTQNPNYNEEKALQLYNSRKTNMLSRLEQQRKDFLDKDFDPKNNWYDSKLTKD